MKKEISQSPNYHTTKRFSENLLAMEMKNNKNNNKNKNE